MILTINNIETNIVDIDQLSVSGMLNYFRANLLKYPHVMVDDPLIVINDRLISNDAFESTLMCQGDSVSIIPAIIGG